MPEKIGRRLILKDGTTFENGECGYSESELWCWIPHLSMQDAAVIFFNTSKTEKITFEFGEMSREYENFTVVIHMSVNNDGITQIGLQRGD